MRVLMLALLIAAMSVAVCQAEDTDTPDDWFGMTEMQVGTLWNFETEEWQPFVSAPVIGWKDVRAVVGAEFDIDEETEAKGPVAFHVAATYFLGSLADMGVDVPLAEHIGLNIGPSWRYDIDTGESALCIMATVVDVSFGEGNVDKHKNR